MACWVDVWWLRLVTTDGRTFRWRCDREWRERLPLKYQVTAKEAFTVDHIEALDGNDQVLCSWDGDGVRLHVGKGNNYTFSVLNFNCGCCPEKSLKHVG